MALPGILCSFPGKPSQKDIAEIGIGDIERLAYEEWLKDGDHLA